MYVQSHVSTTTVHELLIAVDVYLNVRIERHIQMNMNLFTAAYDSFGLTINMEKMVIMRHPPVKTTYIHFNGIRLQAVDITYLDITLSHSTEYVLTPGPDEE
ncbi:unnamed protein product [Schistocephalus solidus]|uniref:Reverse transcriptase domain-containing protein n=1 Tax=Schistocephalus solidus TaxID=70667 RepID=A0A183SGH1_SCHSO|nr:unnamed protein product [Schistocephalus solidus]